MNTEREQEAERTGDGSPRNRRLVAVALLSVVAAAAGFFITNPISATSATEISVTARGDAGSEKIELIADGTVLDTFTLGQSLDSYSATAPAHPSNVRVRFINDRRSNGVDLNAIVESISVAGKDYSSTDPSVLSTGTYQRGRGCSEGNARSPKLHCNGYFEFRIGAAAPVAAAAIGQGTTRVEVRAQGTTGEERVELRLGSEVLATWRLTKSPKSYIHELSQSPSGQALNVAFVNDARTDAGDRNVQIDFLAVAGRKIEAEDPSVYSEGTYGRSTGCDGGNKRSEFLHCEGFMRFAIPVDAPLPVVVAPAVEEPEAAPVAEPVPASNPVEETEVPSEPVDVVAADDDAAVEAADPADEEAVEPAADEEAVEEQVETEPVPTTTTTAPPASDNVTVSVFARGNTGSERIELRVDNRTVARFDITKSLQEYTYTSNKSISPRALAIHFVNDARTSSGSRDVTLDRIVVDGKQFQTEAASTEILGSWTNGSCKSTGYHREETLRCNGYAKYDIGGAGQLDSSTPEAQVATPVSVASFPKAGHNGQVGCVSNCKTVGFQDLDGKNGTVLENLIISNPGGPCLSIQDASNITIRNVTLRNCATSTNQNKQSIVNIQDSSNVTITGSKFINNASRRVTNYDLIHVEDATNVTIRNNEIRDVHSYTNGKGSDSGNRAIRVTGNRVRNLTIEHNSFYNPGRNALQITRARNLTGIRFVNNRVEGQARWNSEFEDMLNFYSASGTSASPIMVTGNYLRNGGPSGSGTAIILGDGEGNASSAYINVERNVIVDPGHVGINVAGGHHFKVRDNIIYGGSNVDIWTSTGLTINHYRYTPDCRDHVISGNRVYFKNQHRQHNGTNHIWNPGTCRQNVKFYSNKIGDKSLSYSVWDLD